MSAEVCSLVKGKKNDDSNEESEDGTSSEGSTIQQTHLERPSVGCLVSTARGPRGRACILSATCSEAIRCGESNGSAYEKRPADEYENMGE